MPAYSNSTPPQSLQSGGVGYSFGSMDWNHNVGGQGNPGSSGPPTVQQETFETIPAAPPQAGQRVAVCQPATAIDPGSRTVTYVTEFDFAPSALSVSLQGAMRDVDSEYVTIDTDSTDHALVNSKVVTGVRELFLRLILNSITVNNATKMVGKILV